MDLFSEIIMSRDNKGKFITKNKKTEMMRVTRTEKEIVLKMRQTEYVNCVICDTKLEKNSGSEWQKWCENAQQCEKCDSYCYKISPEKTCCACDLAQHEFACELCSNRI